MMNLVGLDTSELSDYCVNLGEPRFRGKQLAKWIYDRMAGDFSAMTDMPARFRERASVSSRIALPAIAHIVSSRDGAEKLLVTMQDNQQVECVYLPYTGRTSLCVSTQVGCPGGCVFCATGVGGFVRNLTAGEIVGQVLAASKHFAARISHVVMMGTGEPLLNFENVIHSIRLLIDEIGISSRRITLSTVGIIQEIDKLADMHLGITLAVSLHAPDQLLRASLIPFAAPYQLSALVESCRRYADLTGRRVTFEYMLLAGVNDTVDHARRLGLLLKGMLCHVNLIPFNHVNGVSFRKPSTEVIRAFRRGLEATGIEVTQRFERGKSADAACGQLRTRSIPR